MAVKIRLARYGAKKNPCYRVVVADARAPRDGKFIEQIGIYQPLQPKDSEQRFRIDAERAKHWIDTGALPTETVLRYLEKTGVVKASPAKQRKNTAQKKAGNASTKGGK